MTTTSTPVDYHIGPRVFRWHMPGVLRRIELAQLSLQSENLAAGCAFVAGLHPDHLEQEGLTGLPMKELAETWPEHMAAKMGQKWSLREYIAAYSDAGRRVSVRFVEEMSAGAVDEAAGNSGATPPKKKARGGRRRVSRLPD